MIPPTIIVSGGKALGYSLKKFAFQQLGILERLMSFQKLNEGYRVVEPYAGVLVECWSSFNLRVVKVHTVGKKIGAPMQLIKEQIKECLCFPHFSVANVLAVYPAVPIKNVDPTTGLEFSETEEQFQDRTDAYNESLRTIRFTYDLSICAIYYYVLFLNATDSNFGVYYVNQDVLATLAAPLPDGTTDCDRNCLLDKEQFEYLTIAPISIDGGIDEWREVKNGYIRRQAADSAV